LEAQIQTHHYSLQQVNTDTQQKVFAIFFILYSLFILLLQNANTVLRATGRPASIQVPIQLPQIKSFAQTEMSNNEQQNQTQPNVYTSVPTNDQLHQQPQQQQQSNVYASVLMNEHQLQLEQHQQQQQQQSNVYTSVPTNDQLQQPQQQNVYTSVLMNRNESETQNQS
jgi:hypothetical protein